MVRKRGLEGARGNFAVMAIFVTSIPVMISGIHTCVEDYPVVPSGCRFERTEKQRWTEHVWRTAFIPVLLRTLPVFCPRCRVLKGSSGEWHGLVFQQCDWQE